MLVIELDSCNPPAGIQLKKHNKLQVKIMEFNLLHEFLIYIYQMTESSEALDWSSTSVLVKTLPCPRSENVFPFSVRSHPFFTTLTAISSTTNIHLRVPVRRHFDCNN